MITTGQVENKYQYVPERKRFRNHYSGEGNSLNRGKSNHIQNNSIQKPLQGSGQTQISFKGFNINTIKKALSLKPTTEQIPQNVVEKVFDSLGKISSEQKTYYTVIKDKYIQFVKESSSFRKKLGFTDSHAEKISDTNLYYIPQRPLLNKFIKQVVSPVTYIVKGIKKLVMPKNAEKATKKAEQDRVLKEFASLQGLIKSHEIWENGYRKMSGNPKLKNSGKFIIPDDVLLSKINRRRNKVVDPNKGKYSTTSLMNGNRLISGIVYSYFLGTDAYNTTMRYSNDKHEAGSQRNSRVAQEFSRIGMNMYIQNLLFGTFETAVNRSIPTALLVSGSTAAFSEILGRKLVGKPIVPSNKEKLDRMENEMSERKGVLPAIGRLLTNVKKKDPSAKITGSAQNQPSITYEKSEANKNLYSAFSEKSKNVSFKGLMSKEKLEKLRKLEKHFFEQEKLFDKQTLKKIIGLLENADEKTGQNFKETILKSAQSSEKLQAKLKELKLNSPQTYEELMNNNEINQIPIGSKKTPWGAVTKSIFVPIKFVKNIVVSTKNLIVKGFTKLFGTKSSKVAKEYNAMLLSKKDVEIEKFNDFYLKRINLEAWKESSLSDNDKKLRIFKEFSEIAEKDKEDIEGIKNIILWLEKQIKKEKIEIQPDGTFKKDDLDKIKKIMKDSVLVADASKHVEYDGNKLSQANINLARAITTIFLVTDAYNLTMQYSKNNKKDANKSAKNRAAQEISRIGLSAYMLAFTHNLLSKLCNSSLGGAFALTAITSSVNDSLSRKVVGVPLTAKNQGQLQEIDKENLKSKSPIRKALAYSLGKKSALPQSKTTTPAKEPVDFFSNDFFIKPEIS